MASNAVLSEYKPTNAGPGTPIIEQVLSARRRVVTQVEEKLIDLGLRSNVKLRFTPDSRNELPAGLSAIVNAIKEIEALPPNWDSYSASPLSDAAVLPALDVAVHALQRCNVPSIRPLPNGGLGIRFYSEAKELEVDIGPDGLGTALLEDLASGEINEVEEPVAVKELLQFVNAFCRAT